MVIDKSSIQIEEVAAWDNPNNGQGFTISWSANIGWGELTFYKYPDTNWKVDSECMCKDEDKEFIRMVLNKFVDELEVTG